jgi:hypothetical protein
MICSVSDVKDDILGASESRSAQLVSICLFDDGIMQTCKPRGASLRLTSSGDGSHWRVWMVPKNRRAAEMFV